MILTSSRARAAAAGVVIALLLVCASGAGAKTFGGVVPDIPTGGHVKGTTPLARIANLPYAGGPVMHSNRTHVIFWQPQGSGLTYDPGYITQVETFLRRVARDSRKTTNVYSLSGQYRDAKGPAAYASTYAGAVLDEAPLPSSQCTEPSPLPVPRIGGPGWSVCLIDAQLMSEISRVIATDHLPRTSRDLYFLVLPYGFGNCEGVDSMSCALGGEENSGYCGYHSSDSEGTLLYAVIPYNAVSGHCQSGMPRPNASTADPALSTISHEHNEAMTDPDLEAPAWIDSNSNENGDLCIDMTEHPPPTLGGSGDSRYSQVIAGGHYWLQEEWSNADRGCRPSARSDSAAFRPPNRIRTGHTIKLTATARTGRARVKAYDWFFGRRGQGHGRTVRHAFSRPGSYRLVLRVTDSWGNRAYAAHTVAVTQVKHSRRSRSRGQRRR